MLLLAPLAAFLVERMKGRVPVTTGAALAALAVAVVTTWPPPGPTTWRRAVDWLAARPGATLLVEAYSPYPDPDRHRIVARDRLVDGPVPPGTDYPVAAETMYGRYLIGAYPKQEAAYEKLFRSRTALPIRRAVEVGAPCRHALLAGVRSPLGSSRGGGLTSSAIEVRASGHASDTGCAVRWS
ncbi:hypothetical protein [Actinophytocola gossypii]|uniref:Uncharacterized protein n=1 Tax=Actinophytocola gossypii TaxID=2812003 RepID=A0ABT2J4Z4_9PSEU|nr:hypothetical protein [Actinophytocola gossypii]MCT2582936.1 hypothetical protein [Actinophytocola gossypii]